jgi:endonuclease YncB( thermonuclease family)
VTNDRSAGRLRARGLCLLAALLIVCAPGAWAGETLSGRVVGVIDGDTVEVLMPSRQMVRVRLAEIDAPEHDQPWGGRAKQLLSGMVFGRSVRLEATTHDRYGRLVARIYNGDRDVNAEMVRRGGAWAYRQYLTDARLIGLETQARTAHLGLWSLPTSQTIPPWDWRHGASRAQRPIGALGAVDRVAAAPAASCGAKRYCREMTSCEEAQFYLRQCGLSRLDGDGDGVPCESLCRGR